MAAECVLLVPRAAEVSVTFFLRCPLSLLITGPTTAEDDRPKERREREMGKGKGREGTMVPRLWPLYEATNVWQRLTDSLLSQSIRRTQSVGGWGVGVGGVGRRRGWSGRACVGVFVFCGGGRGGVSERRPQMRMRLYIEKVLDGVVFRSACLPDCPSVWPSVCLSVSVRLPVYLFGSSVSSYVSK